MHNLDLILTLAAGFLTATCLGYVTLRLGWSPIVGYLLAGVLAGPHTPGIMVDARIANEAAEVGIVLLMFGVGLHFHLQDLISVRRIAISGALVQSAVATLLGALAVRALGWGWPAGLVFGICLSVASTVVLVRVLSDNAQLQSPVGRLAVGWLIVEDILTVFILVLIPVIFKPGGSHGAEGLAVATGMAILKLGVLGVLVLVGGQRLLPWLLNRISQTNSRELFTLSVLAVALGVAAGSAVAFGVSMALGAFLAGMVVGQSEFSARAGAEALPMRDAFAVMFFVSIGMLFDPRELLREPVLVLATLAVVLIAKPLAAFMITTLLGYGKKVGVGVGVALGQIGEFSFLLAVVGRDLGVLPATGMNALVAAAIISIMLNPVLYRALGTPDGVLHRRPRIRKWLASGQSLTVPIDFLETHHRAIVVGYGRVGQSVARLLRERGIEPTIIEMNIETFRRLRGQGVDAIYGDANQESVLEATRVTQASSLILSAAGSSDAVEAIRIARSLNPGIHVVARADFMSQSALMRKAGANEVYSGEEEVALAMTSSILKRLGATPEQLDQEREQIRRELADSQYEPQVDS
ncbi:MAG TPA: cation:proton antiporter [Bryobacteraceae bacterium]|nr:cation:proton antiporter [Bryobacteraceae bacterium]